MNLARIPVPAMLTALLLASLASPVVALQAPSGEEEAPASLTLTFTNNGLPLNENEQGKFYVYEVGERKNYVAWGHTDRVAEFPEGKYDLVIRYENGEIDETITRQEVELIGDMTEEIDFNIPVAHLKIDITRGGVPVEPFTGSYSVYRSGRRNQPLVRKRPGTEITIRPGTYDIEVAHRSPSGMKTQWVEGLLVNGNAYEAVELGLREDQLAQMTVTLLEGGRQIPADKGVWRVFDRGQRASPLAERHSGEMLSIEKGVYDIGAFLERDGTIEERFLLDVEFSDDHEEQIEMGVPLATLRVNIQSGGRPLPGTWFSVYEVGQRDNALLSAQSGEEVQLEPATYDIGCFMRDGFQRADQWLRRQAVRESLTLDVDIEHRGASLRVIPRSRRRRDSVGDPRLLILVDSSSRMRARMESDRRLDIAVPAIAESLSALPEKIQVGLRSIGGDPEATRECRASSLLVAPLAANPEALSEGLSKLRPTGAAPLTYALEQAAADLPKGPENTLVLVTAGSDGCGGDPCEAAGRLLRDERVGRVFVIGFDMDQDQMRRLDCGGEQRAVRDGAGLTAALRDVIRQATTAEDGTFSVFRSDRPSEWIAGGAVGDKIRLSEGKYDILIHSRGRTYKWNSVTVSGDFEAQAGRRPRRR